MTKNREHYHESNNDNSIEIKPAGTARVRDRSKSHPDGTECASRTTRAGVPKGRSSDSSDLVQAGEGEAAENQKKLIPIYSRFIAGHSTHAVSARTLHKALQSKQEFANWIRNRIGKWRFQKGKDFLIKLSKSPKGRPQKEYWLTLDTAKMLAMAENSDMGDQARRYFIECEKKLLEQKQPALPAPAIPERILMVKTPGEPTHLSDMSGKSVVDAEGLRIVRRNMHLLAEQLMWLEGERCGDVLEKQLERLN